MTSWTTPPPASSYAQQKIGNGYGYIRMRDGITLSMTVHLPGPADKGPYPTVIEYSGYSPADPKSPQPSTLITQALGYATVGINMRGTGCSGGAFNYFEQLQSTDGYDAIETIAAQPWVAHHKVGMVGISYPAISQLFVAQLQPPHLAAIAPLSVIDDTIRGTLDPGGVLNSGFAVGWAKDRQHDAEPAPGGGQSWATDRIKGGDKTCLANQALHSQAPDIIQQIKTQNYWTDAIGLPLSPEHFVEQDQRARVLRRRLAGRADRRLLRQPARPVHRHEGGVVHRAERQPRRSVRPGGVRALGAVPLDLRRAEGAAPDRVHEGRWPTRSPTWRSA